MAAPCRCRPRPAPWPSAAARRRTASGAELIRSDLCFLGACGVDAEAGITAFSYEEAEFKRAVAVMSKAVVVAATSEKLATAAPFSMLPAAHLSHLVVEHDADAAQLAAFARLGVQILRARPL